MEYIRLNEKNKSLIKGFLALLILVVFLLAVVPATSFAANATDTATVDDKKDTQVTTKAKDVSNKLTWNANGGKIGTKNTVTTTVRNGDKIGKLPTKPKRAGYELNGWYTKKTGGTKITTNTVSKSKATYYAQWAKIYTVKYDPNGGKVTPTSKKVANKKALGTLATPTRSGYTFNGWYTAKTGGTMVSSATKMGAKNLIVYAQWKKASSAPSRVLNAEEKKLVGTYGYTNIASGFLSTWADGYNNYQQWKVASGTISTVKFKSDGTYESYTLYVSQNRIYISTGNWKISQNGNYILTNYAEEVLSTSTGEKKFNNYPPNNDYGMPYSLAIQDGKQGIIIGATKFYEKI